MAMMVSFSMVACAFLLLGTAIGWFFGERERTAIRDENKKLETKVEEFEQRDDNYFAKRFMEAVIRIKGADKLQKSKEQLSESDRSTPATP